MSRTSAADSWIISFKSNPKASARLFCFPYAGGGASIFSSWSENLPQSVEVCCFNLPGRGGRLREPPIQRLEIMVREMGQALRPYLDKPFAFFGHSMGALLCFELTRYLRREQCPQPLHLFISSRWAPQIPDPRPPLHNLPEEEFIAELRRLNGTPVEILEHAELMELVLPVLRADFAAVETYRYAPEPPLNCPITAFGGLQDTEIGREELAAWREQTIAAFMLRLLPGDHFYLHSSRQLLLHLLAQELELLSRRATAGATQGSESAGESSVEERR
ncbi:MAG: thioesterase II family protein [Pyrinomonadaceae bacterium]